MNLPIFTKLPGAIAIDLDGTLLNSHTQLSERNRIALEKCIERGIPIIIATSRPVRIFNRIFPQKLAGCCSLVIMNGAMAIGRTPLSGQVTQILTENTIRGIISAAQEHDLHTRITIEIDGYDFATNLEGYDFMEKGSLDKETLWQRHAATPEMVIAVEEAIKRKPCKISLGRTDILKLAEILEKQFGSELSIICSDITGTVRTPLLNVTAKTATKPRALKSLLTPHGISLDDVMAIGDDLPDLEMLQACGISMAMANAFPEIKAVCDYNTCSNDEDGVAIVLEKMLADNG
jgi:Cof subfamily protein (haloacid dehalogenase superfamily)